jgi:plastocyanin
MRNDRCTCSRRRIVTALLLSPLTLLLGAGDVTAPPAGNVVHVSIINMSFRPDPLIITVGQTVRWTNNDDRDYTLLAKDQSFKSGNLRPKETFDHQFTEAGTFDYFDVFRPRVMGTIEVKEKS